MDQLKIGKFISQLRLDNDMTQEELAQRLGVSNRSISRWENGRNMPDISLFDSICELFGITLEEFLLGERIAKADDVSIDADAIIEEYKKGKRNRKNRILRRLSIATIVIFGLVSIGFFIASLMISGVVFESIFMSSDLHYDISCILFTMANVSSVLFVIIVVCHNVNYRIKPNIMGVVISLSLCIFVGVGIGYTIYVESNYQYDEPYYFYVDEDGDFKTDQHNPYEKDMKYYPFHSNFDKLSEAIEDIDEDEWVTKFSYMGYELFGVRLVWTNEFSWYNDYANYTMEYYCANNILSKSFKQRLYVDTTLSPIWELEDENEKYQLYKGDDGYMVVITSEDDIFLERVRGIRELGVDKDDIISSALSIYENEHSKIDA